MPHAGRQDLVPYRVCCGQALLAAEEPERALRPKWIKQVNTLLRTPGSVQVIQGAVDMAREVYTALDPRDALIYGTQIDADLGITDRGRRKMIQRGAIPRPDGYFGGRSFWRAATYATFKQQLLCGKYARPLRLTQQPQVPQAPSP
jgi:hypothetical protein